MTTTTTSRLGFITKQLPYGYEALEPEISSETLRYHHDKHYTGYINKLNELVVGTDFEGKTLQELVLTAEGAIYNNAAQAWNHEFYFDQLSANPVKEAMGDLKAAIEREFGSKDKLIEKMTTSAATLFGSGWVWLSATESGDLVITSESNAGNPLTSGLTPLLCLDVWEHAYYIDYRNRRPDAVKDIWRRIDWGVISNRYNERD